MPTLRSGLALVLLALPLSGCFTYAGAGVGFASGVVVSLPQSRQATPERLATLPPQKPVTLVTTRGNFRLPAHVVYVTADSIFFPWPLQRPSDTSRAVVQQMARHEVVEIRYRRARVGYLPLFTSIGTALGLAADLYILSRICIACGTGD
ncbi:MAG: hypothetical protein IAE99_02640 [Rhodothermales bacterium]|nr:hypothetical protein [Rhodothermales bacterium]MCA0270059.1 hypothetical protein [Bacteroidota bacterium]